ncbi:hypothetical protein M8C21_003501 [Ambrosia artemisiifolia]|uniref:Uncharacterized protein n=1 Tax=Ambrosia artemisiifolia TaxID=4212 RepID=A0AAD5BPX3_AMBAR|nr:hypothetical protein M8C21_003501 [Ambrosia artemisiifolia]
MMLVGKATTIGAFKTWCTTACKPAKPIEDGGIKTTKTKFK